MNLKQKAILIQGNRELASKYDNETYQKLRDKLLGWLSVNNWNPSISTCEMYPDKKGDIIKSQEQVYNYFNKNHNTRTKIPSETCLEIDKLPFNKTIAIICEVCLSLIRSMFHFAVFYAEGARSPWIKIYDFEEMTELNPLQRLKVQISFWKKHVPYGAFRFVDTGIFDDEHLLCLEFAPHWKYGTIFNLLFEWIPEKKEFDLSHRMSVHNVPVKKTRTKKTEKCPTHKIELYKTQTGSLNCAYCLLEKWNKEFKENATIK